MWAAVVARPDQKWGETPCAFIELKAGASRPDDQEIVTFCRARLAHFKAPKTFIYGALPKTSTGTCVVKPVRCEVRRGGRASWYGGNRRINDLGWGAS
jgi:acyl-CoA synthetase (AMP-forming)/AMP-acid ligase II